MNSGGVEATIDFSAYYRGLKNIEGNAAFEQWREQLPDLIAEALQPARHGNLTEWWHKLQSLPECPAPLLNCNANAITVSGSENMVDSLQPSLEEQLRTWMPWRKGPFDIHGLQLDSEWRSDLKWDRLKDHIAPLKDKLVLDVGCGNGYHCWRMAGKGARAVIGIDPMLLYVMQYFVLQHFIKSAHVFVLPFNLESVPARMQCFDTAFSMGVLYHRRAPLTHLLNMRDCLKPAGQLVLETLIIAGDAEATLEPEDRYAKMRNVRVIPSCSVLENWLKLAGFKNIRLLDITATTSAEQRVTRWSGTASLADFLDPNDSELTIEGHPAPLRAIYLADKP